MLRRDWERLILGPDGNVAEPRLQAVQSREVNMAQLKPSGDCLDTTATKFATKLAAVRRASAALKVREPAHDSRTADLSLEMSYLEERYPDSFERAGAGHGNDGSRDGGEELPAIGLLSDIGVNDAANESDPWLPPWQPWRAA